MASCESLSLGGYAAGRRGHVIAESIGKSVASHRVGEIIVHLAIAPQHPDKQRDGGPGHDRGECGGNADFDQRESGGSSGEGLRCTHGCASTSTAASVPIR